MLIEFAGCSGSGKTTFARALAAELRDSAGEVSLSGASSLSTTAFNAIAGLVGSLILRRRYATKSAFDQRISRAIKSSAPSPFWTATRKLAAHRLIWLHSRRFTRSRNEYVSVVDEGILCTLSLASSRDEQANAEVRKLFRGIQLADLIVFVDAPLEDIVDRARRRSDKSRELKMLDQKALGATLGSAQDSYRKFFAPDAPFNVIRVWNPDASRVTIEERVATVTAIILKEAAQWRQSRRQR